MIYHADARSIPLPDRSVQCVVTSPPYYSLRDYGVEGQIGLEATPEAYIQQMVAVFREVRRVLKDDGTAWVNMGSSFASNPSKGGSGPNGKNESRWQYGRGARQHGPVYDISDTERLDSHRSDSSLSRLCDGCRVALQAQGNAHSGHLRGIVREPLSCESSHERMVSERGHLPTLDSQSRADHSEDATLDSSLAQSMPDGGPLDVPGSTTLESSGLPQGECWHCDNCDVCLSVLRSSSRDGSLCARRADDILDRAEKDELSVYRRTDKVLSSKAWRYLTTTCLKQKDDMAIPWLLALALRMDGWYLRSDIIWAKPSPMPESVCDRPTRSHEYIFLLTKQSSYYYDADAVREPQSETTIERFASGVPRRQSNKAKTVAHNGTILANESYVTPLAILPNGRNRRSVWTIPSEPCPEAHFATFPQKLVEPCVLAGTSAKGECIQCGANWVREVETSGEWRAQHERIGKHDGTIYRPNPGGGIAGPNTSRVRTDRGWRPTCSCDAGTRPNLVFDPFLGSGTVGVVCERLGRRWAGTELNPGYIEIAKKRTCQQGLFSHAGMESKRLAKE